MKFEGFRIEQLIILSHKAPGYGKLLPRKYVNSPPQNRAKEKYTDKLCALEQYLLLVPMSKYRS
jgi:hypothetical protein